MRVHQFISHLATDLSTRLHLDVRFYGRSFFWMSLGQMSTVVRGIATTFLMARWIPRTTFGEFRYILAMFGLAGIFSLSGINTSVIRGIAKGDTVIARVAAKRIFFFSLLGTLALLGLGVERYLRGEQTVAFGLAFTAIIFPFYSLSNMYGSILTGKDEIKRLIKLAITNNLLFSILFFGIILHWKTLIPLLIAYFGFDLLFRGYMTCREIRKLPVAGSAKEHLHLGNHLSLIGIFQAIAFQLDQVLIQAFAGYNGLANFSVATLLPEQVKDFVNSMSGIILKRFSRHEHTESILRQTRRHFRLALLGSAVLVIGYCLCVPIVLPWLFPQYRTEVLPSMVYALGFLAFPSIIGLSYFQAHQNIRALWRFYAVNTILQISSNVVLIPFLGAWGGILSKTFTRLASAGLSYPAESEKKESV